jgi:hypothetical protein
VGKRTNDDGTDEIVYVGIDIDGIVFGIDIGIIIFVFDDP